MHFTALLWGHTAPWGVLCLLSYASVIVPSWCIQAAFSACSWAHLSSHRHSLMVSERRRDIRTCSLTGDEKVLASFIYLFSFEHILERGKKNTHDCQKSVVRALDFEKPQKVVSACKSYDNLTSQRGSRRVSISAIRMSNYSTVGKSIFPLDSNNIHV